ncbi:MULTISPECIES: alpha/beta hydrolase [Methylotenera]|uniref:alpha/beta hydrolase n=1 Tax=Methylotenera TaxID=359407 RepID=UPI0003789887|nr:MULTISPECIES: alpha/beta hydrolase fold domain-containing protein [Methylotenera]
MTEQPIEIATSEPINASVIWMHGLGADGNDFVPVVKMLNLPHVRFILPHAPYRNITRNNGYEMRAWYDVYGLTPISREDDIGIGESQLQIEQLIAQEISRGIPANRIVLAGFSQGGAIALHTALRYTQPLAGVLALSTYLPLRANLAAEKTEANQQTPIFMAHGRDDAVITLETCQVSLSLLLAEDYAVDWHEYAMEHSVCAQEIEDIKQFLLTVLKV